MHFQNNFPSLKRWVCWFTASLILDGCIHQSKIFYSSSGSRSFPPGSSAFQVHLAQIYAQITETDWTNNITAYWISKAKHSLAVFDIFFAILGHPKFTNNEKTKFPWGLETCDMPWLVKIQCQSLPTLRLRRGKSLSRLDARFILHYCYSHFLRQFKSHSKAHTLGVNQTNDIRSKWIFKQMHVKEDCQKLLSGFFPLMGYPNDPNEVSHIWKSAISFQNTKYLLKFVIYRSLLLGHPTPWIGSSAISAPDITAPLPPPQRCAASKRCTVSRSRWICL